MSKTYNTSEYDTEGRYAVVKFEKIFGKWGFLVFAQSADSEIALVAEVEWPVLVAQEPVLDSDQSGSGANELILDREFSVEKEQVLGIAVWA